MGVWTRMKRSMRALFGGVIERTEDPELILQQTIRDMRDRVPELNNSVAQVMATEKLLAKNKERLEGQVVDDAGDTRDRFGEANRGERGGLVSGVPGQGDFAVVDACLHRSRLDHQGAT